MAKSKRNFSAIYDAEGNKIVMINDIIFKNRQKIDWLAVEEYLKQYIGEFYTMADSNEIVFIGKDLPKEYSHSMYTHKLKGTLAKAKANAAQVIPEIIINAKNGKHRPNVKDKHKRDAANGWYKYESGFAMPVYNSSGNLERYNIFYASIIIRRDKRNKLFLYDIIDIKKEMDNPF